MLNGNDLTCWAVTAPGLEPLAIAELTALGVVVGEHEPGGVSFTANRDQLADALLWLRTVSRVTVRLAEFSARTFAELERRAATVDWGAILPVGSAVHFRVTSKKSRLYHQDAIAERLERVVLAVVKESQAIRAPSAADALEADVTKLPGMQRIIVRVWRDQVTLSADASGGLLHRRGWRQAVGKAPLRETLAAAMLLGVGWDGSAPLSDPFGGSGTIAIEAALLARAMAPGRGRRFAAEAWPMFGEEPMRSARQRALLGERPRVAVTIECFDRDDGAVIGARSNALRAGVGDDLLIERATIAMLGSDRGAGLLLTNPPYGARMGERMALRDLYATLGRVRAERRPAWQLAILSADPMLAGHVGVSWEEIWRTTNGGIPVRLLRNVSK